jgi:hypothetical protein
MKRVKRILEISELQLQKLCIGVGAKDYKDFKKRSNQFKAELSYHNYEDIVDQYNFVKKLKKLIKKEKKRRCLR